QIVGCSCLSYFVGYVSLIVDVLSAKNAWLIYRILNSKVTIVRYSVTMLSRFLQFVTISLILRLFIPFFTDSVSLREANAYSFLEHRSMPLLQSLRQGPLKISVIGSGNWGSVIGKIVATNARNSYIFNDDVRMWVYDELVNNEKLTHIINSRHENVKYLPGIRLPTNLKADPSLEDSVKSSHLLIFVLPHQFLKRACQTLAASAGFHPNAKAISLIKGLYVDDSHKPKLSSEIIKDTLGIECCVLSGANVAKVPLAKCCHVKIENGAITFFILHSFFCHACKFTISPAMDSKIKGPCYAMLQDVADGQFSETTIGYTDMESAMIWQQLLDTPYFKINGVPDVAGVELCGAVKNVIALAAGFCDGLNFGTNTKAAVIRQGFEELRRFATYFYTGLVEETFFDSAGIADTITTCFGGRNVKCAAEFVRCQGSKTWAMIEEEMLNGQKLQGTLTCEDVYKVLKHHNLIKEFPLFSATYRVAFEGCPATEIVNIFKVDSLRPIRPASACNPCLVPTFLHEVDQEVRIYLSPLL
ncbi:putative glycerol-3-phosphate dehydrogenase (gpdh), partial [Cardiosporidium cionae]